MDDAGTITALACAISRFLKEGELTGSWRSSGPCCKESVPNAGKANAPVHDPHLPHGLPAALDLDAETRPVLEPDAEVQLGGLRGRFQFVDLGLAVALGVVPAPVWCGPVHAGVGKPAWGWWAFGSKGSRFGCCCRCPIRRTSGTTRGRAAIPPARWNGRPEARAEGLRASRAAGMAGPAAGNQGEAGGGRGRHYEHRAGVPAQHGAARNTTVGENMLPRLREIVASGHLPPMLPAAHPIALGPPTQ